MTEDLEKYRLAYKQLRRRRIYVFGGLVVIMVQFVVTLYVVQHFRLASRGHTTLGMTLVLAEFLAYMLVLNVWGRHQRCPRCGGMFFLPDQWKPIKACVHCGLPLTEITRLGKMSE